MGKLADHLDIKASSMGDMFERCGVDLATLAAAVRSCVFCRAEDECRLWLDIQGDSKRVDPPTFCPNAGRIRRTQR